MDRQDTLYSARIAVGKGTALEFGSRAWKIDTPRSGSVNRRAEGELGKFKVDLGDGYLLHRTRDSTSIGTAATHGCVRLGDKDLSHLYENIPVGTPVFIR